jgi:hypothetical protein
MPMFDLPFAGSEAVQRLIARAVDGRAAAVDDAAGSEKITLTVSEFVECVTLCAEALDARRSATASPGRDLRVRQSPAGQPEAGLPARPLPVASEVYAKRAAARAAWPSAAVRTAETAAP